MDCHKDFCAGAMATRRAVELCIETAAEAKEIDIGVAGQLMAFLRRHTTEDTDEVSAVTGLKEFM